VNPNRKASTEPRAIHSPLHALATFATSYSASGLNWPMQRFSANASGSGTAVVRVASDLMEAGLDRDWAREGENIRPVSDLGGSFYSWLRSTRAVVPGLGPSALVIPLPAEGTPSRPGGVARRPALMQRE